MVSCEPRNNFFKKIPRRHSALIKQPSNLGVSTGLTLYTPPVYCILLITSAFETDTAKCSDLKSITGRVVHLTRSAIVRSTALESLTAIALPALSTMNAPAKFQLTSPRTPFSLRYL